MKLINFYIVMNIVLSMSVSVSAMKPGFLLPGKAKERNVKEKFSNSRDIPTLGWFFTNKVVLHEPRGICYKANQWLNSREIIKKFLNDSNPNLIIPAKDAKLSVVPKNPSKSRSFRFKVFPPSSEIYLFGRRIILIPRKSKLHNYIGKNKKNKIIEALYADCTLVDKTDGNYTPLHLCVDSKKIALAEIFLIAGANPNIKTSCGRTALDIAQKEGLVELAELLKNYGAKSSFHKN